MRHHPVGTPLWLHPVAVHWSVVHATPSLQLVSPTQVPPPSQWSSVLHGLPSSHDVVDAAAVHPLGFCSGTHRRHDCPGFCAPAA